MEQGFQFHSVIPDYGFAFSNRYFGYILSALVGVIIILIIFKLIGKINLKRKIKGD